jgi:mono/diheme cytochrome c family protein
MRIAEHCSTRAFAVAAGVLISCGALAPPAHAQSAPSVGGGPALFRQYCAACHGTSGRGDGPMASMLKVRPTDLTRLAARNRGTFPVVVVTRTIDGRVPVAGHGGEDMPVWGEAFRKSSDPAPVDQRIQMLVTHLESLQVTP